MGGHYQPYNTRSASLDMFKSVLRIRLTRRAALHMGFENVVKDVVKAQKQLKSLKKAVERGKMSVASEQPGGSGCRLRGGSASNSAAQPSNQLKGAALQPRPRPCRMCWYCCCSCSCLSLRSEDESSKDNKSSNNENTESDKPTLDDIRSWGTSFDKLMKSPAGRNVFRDFLRSEYSEENILFWLACEELKKLSQINEIEEKARFIYEEYISILSPKEVSLDARVRDSVNKNMVRPNPHIFDEAQLQIYTLMHRDSYPRFVNSAMYKEMIKGNEQPEGASTSRKDSA